MAKEFLTSQNVPFEDIDVSVDAAAREDMVEKSGQLGVPVFDIDGQIMVGYNQQLLSKVVGIGTDGSKPADPAKAADSAASKADDTATTE